jgi:hypothetical protein
MPQVRGLQSAGAFAAEVNPAESKEK